MAARGGWDLKQLRDDVGRVFGELQRQAISPSLNTIVERRQFTRYHWNEARQLIDEAVGDRNNPELLAVILGAFDKEPGDFEWSRLRAAAHITCCVHSMHSIADILGQVVYLGLGMNRDPAKELEERQTNAYSVRDRLDTGKIKDLFHQLLDHNDFVYLAALNNQSKHRSIVPVPYTVDMTGEDEERHGMKFSGFLYENTWHPARWVRPFLREEYRRQEGLIMAIGNAVNRQLTAKA